MALSFSAQALRRLKTVGALKGSSPKLAERVLEHIDFDRAQHIVEFGAGDGAITKYLLDRLQGHTRFSAYEVIDSYRSKLKNVVGNRGEVHKDALSAKERGVDYLVCGIPLTTMKPRGVFLDHLCTMIAPTDSQQSLGKLIYYQANPKAKRWLEDKFDVEVYKKGFMKIYVATPRIAHETSSASAK